MFSKAYDAVFYLHQWFPLVSLNRPQHCTTPRSVSTDAVDPVSFQLFVPCTASDSLSLRQSSLSCSSHVCATGCAKIQHMPRIHKTLPNAKVIKTEKRLTLCLYQHHDNRVEGGRVIWTAK